MARAAVIDVGTNSIKMVIGESDNAGSVSILDESSVNARLGEGLASARLIRTKALERGINAIAVHVANARGFGVDQIRIVGTNVIRDAVNSIEMTTNVKLLFNLHLEELSGEDEAEYAFLAITGDPQLGGTDDPQMIVDSGGGSTEMIMGVGNQITSSVSIDIGAVRIMERFLKAIPSDNRSLADARRSIHKELRPYLGGKHPSRLICVGGSAVNLARIIYEIHPENTFEVHARRLALKDLEDLISKLAGMNLDERRSLIGLEPERADIIPGGALIIEQILLILGLHETIISVRGLRHAVLFEMLGAGRHRSIS